MDSLDTLSVSQLHLAIRESLEGAFPDDLWVRGEVQGLFHSKAGHTYFDLVEHRGGVVRGRQAQIVGKIPVVLFRGSRFIADRIMKRSAFELAEGVEVRISGRVGSFAERGALQFVMRSIDPTFTFGQIAEAKDRLLKALSAEGLLRANALTPFPELPLHIGLVTSAGSDAYEDFLAELKRHPYNWRIDVFDARVQGAEAPGTLSRALKAASARCPAVAIVRGGGSGADLRAFNDEALARAIAACPVPVVVGIGHETDRSVADEVAAFALKTPTSCAAFFAEKVDDIAGQISLRASDVQRRGRSRLDAAQQRTDWQRERLSALPTRTLQRETAHIAAASLRAQTATGRLHRRELDRLADRRARLIRTAERTIARGHSAVQERLLNRSSRVARCVERAESAVSTRAELVRARDPLRALQRGFALVQASDGSLIKSTGSVRSGERLVVTVADGSFDVAVGPGAPAHGVRPQSTS